MQFQRNDKKRSAQPASRGPARRETAAGKKASAAALPVTPSRKPRTCGEKMMKAGSNCAMLGSPPRMRGKVGNRPGGQLPVGITPACAGKSLPLRHSTVTGRDHPRMCGEKAIRDCVMKTVKGSPPHVRGKAEQCNRRNNQPGITPTYAGKSFWRCKARRRCRDHPPHMRGKVHSSLLVHHHTGITPAYAGKRGFEMLMRKWCGDHPRVCGEKPA